MNIIFVLFSIILFIFHLFFFYSGRVGINEDPAPPVTTSPPQSPCVFAIVTCCKTRNLKRRAGCFNALKCEGAWYDGDLCKDEKLHREVNAIIFDSLGF